VLLLRERKHLIFALIARLLLGVTVVSELHEGGIPLTTAKSFRRKFQWFLDSVDGIVFTNYSQLHFLANRGYAIPRNHIVLPNGVNTRYFQCAQPASLGSPQVMLTYAGQFTPWKNIPLLFESLQYLPEHFRLRIAGGKVQGSSKAYVDGLVKQFHVDGRVDYLGFVAPGQIVETVLSGSSVLLLPLGDSDIAQFATSPMKLVEYMATQIKSRS
jgi:glycosyltransferase involved in cell wall biosynthesis